MRSARVAAVRSVDAAPGGSIAGMTDVSRMFRLMAAVYGCACRSGGSAARIGDARGRSSPTAWMRGSRGHTRAGRPGFSSRYAVSASPWAAGPGRAWLAGFSSPSSQGHGACADGEPLGPDRAGRPDPGRRPCRAARRARHDPRAFAGLHAAADARGRQGLRQRRLRSRPPARLRHDPCLRSASAGRTGSSRTPTPAAKRWPAP